MRIAAFIGPSGSGKTTLIVSLIRHFVAHGERVAAIKHTHHPLNEERRGDTFKFERAGAAPVFMAGDADAVVFTHEATRRITFASPEDLLAQIDADIVFVEGFKEFAGWPHISSLDFEEALGILSRIWPSR
ncbi:MAG TPA: molybdopterin-guanine dinucleotide biosynthesis protein MobB [Thermoanaerobaculia bacterium]|nr:molybdopterin-guanine dinucleotide biosynthesis protein MobB [Thermoanaerobaculia bacterium]